MARPLRLAFPGAVYHVTSRGNVQAALYAADTDRTTFLALLAQYAADALSAWHAPAKQLRDRGLFPQRMPQADWQRPE